LSLVQQPAMIRAVSEEIDLAAKSVGESVGALAEASGILGPVNELAEWVTSFIHYRRQPALAKQVMKAADKIQASGLPSAAVSDKLLRDLLEGGSMEDDPDMQERWANLLANAITVNPPEVKTAFPKILRELDPVEAHLIDAMAVTVSTTEPFLRPSVFPQATVLGFIFGNHYGDIPFTIPPRDSDNLLRLGLLREVTGDPERSFTVGGAPPILGYSFTALGWDFVNACRSPPSAACP
jgi:hypothetical protein